MKKFIIVFLIMFSIGAIGAYSANKTSKTDLFQRAVDISPLYTCKDGNVTYPNVRDFKTRVEECKFFQSFNMMSKTAYDNWKAAYDRDLKLYNAGKCVKSGVEYTGYYKNSTCELYYSKKDNSISTNPHRCISQQECDVCYMKLANFVKAKNPNVRSHIADLKKYGIPVIEYPKDDSKWDQFLIGYDYTGYISNNQVCYYQNPEASCKKDYSNYCLPDKRYKAEKCYPLKVKSAGAGQNTCQIAYFFVNGTPYVHYVGPTKLSEGSNSIGSSCMQLVSGIQKQYPKTVFLPVVKRNIEVIQNYYNR